jgi:hypothetical protein
VAMARHWRPPLAAGIGSWALAELTWVRTNYVRLRMRPGRGWCE